MNISFLINTGLEPGENSVAIEKPFQRLTELWQAVETARRQSRVLTPG